MNNIPPKKILYVCLTHIELFFNYPEFVKTIYMGKSQYSGRLNLEQLSPEWAKHHPVLGGTAGSFALKELIINSNDVYSHVGICQYRKFLTREKIGLQASNYKVMDIVNAEKLDVNRIGGIMTPVKSDFLVSKPGLFSLNEKNYGYLYQYKDVHFIEDFLRFVAIAVEEGALNRGEICDFFDEKIFFPGGIELGVMPIKFWIKHITLLESVVRRCIEEHPYKREGFQSRIWAFCCERLGSYFLLKEFRSRQSDEFDWMDSNTGYLNLLVKNDEKNYIPGV